MLYGYSGAAHASAWASTLSAGYAPDLKIVGAAFGGTPVDLVANIKALNEGPVAVLAGLAILGLANGYSALNETLNAGLTTNGSQVAQTLRTPTFCAVTNITDFSGFDFTTIFRGDIFGNRVFQHVLAEKSLLSTENIKPVPVSRFPRFQFHGIVDTIVPYKPAMQFVKEQCAGGADIRFVAFPGLGHSQANLAGLPGALQFLEQAFEKRIPRVKCSNNVSVPAIGSEESIEILGPNNNIVLAAEFAVATL